MINSLRKPIVYLKGVGPKRAECYEKMGIETVWDLLNHFPRDYIDYSEPVSILDAPLNEPVIVKGRIVKKLPEAHIRKGLSVYKAIFTDDTSDIVIVIYNNGYFFKQLELEREYVLYGKLTGNLLRKEINSPVVFPADSDEKIKPVYRLTEGISQQLLRQNMRNALNTFNDNIYEPVPKWIMRENKLCSLGYAMENIHFPKDMNACKMAKDRLVFDELLILQLGMLMLKSRSRSESANRLKDIDISNFYKSLPFELTNCQKNAITDCISDMKGDYPMNRLIQGDVGSGKTAVAAGAAYFVHKNRCQTALMAPTEILAQQHFETLKSFLQPLDVNVCLLTGSMTVKQKNAVKEQIQSGKCSIAVGTHALIQQSTQFKNLALVITDEQHRFGVEQRAELAGKGNDPHKLVMSATPIPRTLALMIYGDLDISVLDELPKGRQPIKTYAVTGKLRERAFNFVKQHIDKGQQGYIVCPMIEENVSELQNVKSYAEKLQKSILSGCRIDILHGKMTAEKKEKVMEDFKNHKTDLLVTTTVVEVGVDVPNATIMVVENADRFGLSQLHQLRGRVGRGSEQSDCVLITDNVTDEIKKRLKILSSTSDGFKISEEDLKMRGPGDFFGSRQHGLPNLKIADMSEDMDVLRKAQKTAKKIISADPKLENKEYGMLKELINRLFDKTLSEN